MAIAESVAESGADMIGFNFVKRSPRYIEYDLAKAIVDELPDSMTPVALVNHLTHRDQFLDLSRRTGINFIQLHGEEAPGLAATIEELHLLRALPAEAVEDSERLAAWSIHPHVEAFLWDAPSSPDNPLGGGSGQTSDWTWLSARLPGARPSILAGGLTPDNVGEAIRTVRPWGVDVSSGVESSRGVKDHGLIRAFCEAVREADASLAND